MKYTDFVRAIGVELTPGQLAFAKVAFDGEKIEEGIGAEVFGGVFDVPEAARFVVTIVAGGRSGKTYLCGLRMLHLALTVDMAHLAPGEEGFVFIVSPRKDELSMQAMRYITGVCAKVPALQDALIGKVKPTDAEFRMRGKGGRTVTFRAISASEGGVSGRGRSVVAAMLEECAFFRDSSYQINDKEIFEAIEPRVVEGGQLLVPSTPWAETGLLYELFRDNFGKAKRSLVAHATTRRMREGGPGWKKIKWQIDGAFDRDPENAAREFDAEFMSGSAGQFFDQASVDQAIRPGEVKTDPLPGARVVAAADFGFKHDSSALAIVQLYKGQSHLSRVLELKPERGKPLKPSEVVAAFAQELLRYGCKTVMADGHHRESLQEHLHKHGLGIIPAPEGRDGKAQVYNRAKETLYEGRLIMPFNDRLIRQLKEVVAKPVAGGGVTIQSPRWKQGGHGDIASAVVLAMYQVFGEKIPDEKPKSYGETRMDEAFKKAADARRALDKRNNRLPVTTVARIAS